MLRELENPYCELKKQRLILIGINMIGKEGVTSSIRLEIYVGFQ